MTDVIDAYFDKAVVDLRRNVVCCRFLTADERVREMWCTRNGAIIEVKAGGGFDGDNPSSIEKERSMNHITVYDLQKQSFRKVNLSTLEEGGWQLYPLDHPIPDISTNVTAFKAPKREKPVSELNLPMPEGF